MSLTLPLDWDVAGSFSIPTVPCSRQKMQNAFDFSGFSLALSDRMNSEHSLARGALYP
jgi:hypothetical protein